MKLWMIVDKETNYGNKKDPLIFETKEEAEGFVRVMHEKSGEIYDVIGFDKTKIGLDKIILDDKKNKKKKEEQ